MSETKHTPVPWAVSDSHGLCVRAGKTLVADLDTGCRPPTRWSGTRADAQFIVRACNAHDDLLEACKVSVAAITGGRLFRESLVPGAETPLVQLTAAIAKAVQ